MGTVIRKLNSRPAPASLLRWRFFFWAWIQIFGRRYFAVKRVVYFVVVVVIAGGLYYVASNIWTAAEHSSLPVSRLIWKWNEWEFKVGTIFIFLKLRIVLSGSMKKKQRQFVVGSWNIKWGVTDLYANQCFQMIYFLPPLSVEWLLCHLHYRLLPCLKYEAQFFYLLI